MKNQTSDNRPIQNKKEQELEALEALGFKGQPNYQEVYPHFKENHTVSVSDHEKVLGPRLFKTYDWMTGHFAEVVPTVSLLHPEISSYVVTAVKTGNRQEYVEFFRRFCPDWYHKERIGFHTLTPEEWEKRVHIQVRRVVNQWAEKRYTPKLRTATHAFVRQLHRIHEPWQNEE